MRTFIIHEEGLLSDYAKDRLFFGNHFVFDSNNPKLISEIISKKPDIIILELIKSLNKETKISLVKEIRNGCGGIPILFIVSSCENIFFIQNLLDSGADACIKGDFLKEEFILRASKLIEKKNNLLFSGTCIKTSNTTLDIKNHYVCLGEDFVSLTKTEHNILFHLFMHKNKLIKNEELSLCLKNKDSIKSDYLLNIHIHNLRKKLSGADWIKTVVNYGFIVND